MIILSFLFFNIIMKLFNNHNQIMMTHYLNYFGMNTLNGMKIIYQKNDMNLYYL